MNTSLKKPNMDTIFENCRPIRNMDKGHVTLLVLLDLSAAFDTVDQKVMLQVLESRYGISGKALEWFSLYLCNRTQRSSVNGTLSDSFTLQHGAPQGSCLGPLLFIIYDSKLFDVAKVHLPNLHAFANDSQSYISFKPELTTSAEESREAMEKCIEDVLQWMLTDRLKLNDRKTEHLIIGSQRKLLKLESRRYLNIGDHQIDCVEKVKNLGCWFDENLSMITQINKICSASYYHLRNIKSIKPVTDEQVFYDKFLCNKFYLLV